MPLRSASEPPEPRDVARLLQEAGYPGVLEVWEANSFVQGGPYVAMYVDQKGAPQEGVVVRGGYPRPCVVVEPGVLRATPQGTPDPRARLEMAQKILPILRATYPAVLLEKATQELTVWEDLRCAEHYAYRVLHLPLTPRGCARRLHALQQKAHAAGAEEEAQVARQVLQLLQELFPGSMEELPLQEVAPLVHLAAQRLLSSVPREGNGAYGAHERCALLLLGVHTWCRTQEEAS